VAFVNANPGTKVYIKILDKMVGLGFVTADKQREYTIQLENNTYSNVDAVLCFFDK